MQPLPYFLSHHNYKGREKICPTDCSVALSAPSVLIGWHSTCTHTQRRARALSRYVHKHLPPTSIHACEEFMSCATSSHFSTPASATLLARGGKARAGAASHLHSPNSFHVSEKANPTPRPGKQRESPTKDSTLTVKRQAHALNQLPGLPLAQLSPSSHFIDICKNKYIQIISR